MQLTWDGYCFMCQNPLDVYIETSSWRDYDIAVTYSNFVTPPDFRNNYACRAYIDGKTRFICAACRKNRYQKKFNMKNVFNREIGRKLSMHKSLPINAIDGWWEKFKNFGTRPDVDKYIMVDVRFLYPEPELDVEVPHSLLDILLFMDVLD
jgi:ribosomal protein L33